VDEGQGLVRPLLPQPPQRLQLGPQPVQRLAAEAGPARHVEVGRIPALPAAGPGGRTGSAVAVGKLRAREEVLMGEEGFAIEARGRRVLLPAHDDHPDEIQHPLGEEALVPGRAGGARRVARVRLVQAAELLGRLGQGPLPGDDLLGQGPPGRVAVQGGLQVGVEFLAVLDRPGEGEQGLVPPTAPQAEGEAGPQGGEGGHDEKGGAKLHGWFPRAKPWDRTGTRRPRPQQRAPRTPGRFRAGEQFS
jgi:hypothetical protein